MMSHFVIVALAVGFLLATVGKQTSDGGERSKFAYEMHLSGPSCSSTSKVEQSHFLFFSLSLLLSQLPLLRCATCAVASFPILTINYASLLLFESENLVHVQESSRKKPS